MKASQNKPAGPAVVLRRVLPRRQFLRGAGVAFGLPILDAMRPAFAAGNGTGDVPRRMLAICNNLGLLPAGFFPAQPGKDYTPSPYLKVLDQFRDDYTVFSGVSHPDVDGSHASEVCFLTAAPHPANGGFRNSISLDQYMADRIGERTRFPSLTLGVNVNRGQRNLTWTGSGVMIPCESCRGVAPCVRVPARCDFTKWDISPCGRTPFDEMMSGRTASPPPLSSVRLGPTL